MQKWNLPRKWEETSEEGGFKTDGSAARKRYYSQSWDKVHQSENELSNKTIETWFKGSKGADFHYMLVDGEMSKQFSLEST